MWTEPGESGDRTRMRSSNSRRSPSRIEPRSALNPARSLMAPSPLTSRLSTKRGTLIASLVVWAIRRVAPSFSGAGADTTMWTTLSVSCPTRKWNMGFISTSSRSRDGFSHSGRLNAAETGASLAGGIADSGLCCTIGADCTFASFGGCGLGPTGFDAHAEKAHATAGIRNAAARDC